MVRSPAVNLMFMSLPPVQAVNRAPIVAMLRAAAASPNSGLSQQLDFHELGWLRTPLRRRCCASVGGEERKPPIFTRSPSPVTGRGADEFWSEGIASDANPIHSVFCRLERQTINRLSMRRQIGEAGVLIDSHEQLFRSTGVV